MLFNYKGLQLSTAYESDFVFVEEKAKKEEVGVIIMVIFAHLSIRAAHKSLERSLSLVVLLLFLPSGGDGRLTCGPILVAEQKWQIQSPSGTDFRGGLRQLR